MALGYAKRVSWENSTLYYFKFSGIPGGNKSIKKLRTGDDIIFIHTCVVFRGFCIIKRKLHDGAEIRNFYFEIFFNTRR